MAKGLIEYLTKYGNKWTPQCVVVFGGTKTDRDDWIADKADELYFEESTRYTSFLHYYEERLYRDTLHIDYFAEEILNTPYLPGVAIDDIRHPGQGLKEYIDYQQVIMNAICDCAVVNDPHIDLSQIKWNGFIKQWVNRYKNALKSHRPKIREEFVEAFKKEYFDKLFSNYDFFSVNGQTKDYYRKEFAHRLKKNLERLEFKDPTDLLISLTNEDEETLKRITDLCGQTHTIKTVNLKDNPNREEAENPAKE